MNIYTFSKLCIPSILSEEIKNSSVSTGYSHIEINELIPEMNIIFLSELSEEQLDVLSALVLNHNINQIIPEEQQQLVEVSIKETPPFAKPDFRTKRNATAGWVNCEPGTTSNIDHVLQEDLYVCGGELIVDNAKKGDFVSAEVFDYFSGIPQEYRSTLCENWPTVAKYIIKQWVQPGTSTIVINTYPLNARVTAGLSLRVTYNTSQESGTRSVAVNYYLAKKL